jgi:FkbH-like protein
MTAISTDQLATERVLGRIKCVIWDLDNTVWTGTLLEGDAVQLQPKIIDLIRSLDEVGILHSVASKNDHHAAMEVLKAFGMADYFLYPQISWDAKSEAVLRIQKALNIGLDAIAFVDDQQYELAEVAHVLPDVTCIHVDDIHEMAQTPAFRPRFVTDESTRRREMYRSAAARDEAEREFVGASDEFLATLDMQMRIWEATAGDLERAEELTLRTNQLNSTGRTMDHEDLDALRQSDRHLLLVASLDDRFGSYGQIGLALVEKGLPCWRLHLLLMSCRVVSRGVGTVLLNHVMRLAQADGADLEAVFVPTGRNRMMQITYMFAGFREVANEGGELLLRASLEQVQPTPSYLTLGLG